MAKKYHINPKTGNVDVWTASVRTCPISNELAHFDNKAKEVYEKFS